ncbi:MAG: hypothetical protein HY223_05200 [Thaumarchaeota archaeon]|nr:hypothetical protein [Nitrososphaerota archaeon]
MKNALIDKQVNYLERDEFQDLFKEYDEKFVVGKDMKQTSFDENCANICIERNCDFITADKEAYHHFFKIKQVKSVEIFQFMKREPKIDRPVYCMRIKMEHAKTKTITKEQMKALQEKTRGNVDRLLEFLYQIIGYPEDKKYVLTKVHVYECYAVFTHAVEEYGKLLYLKTLEPDEEENYTIEYSKKFANHKTKFELALGKLPKSIKVVYEGDFSSDYGSSNMDSDIEATWENRLNVLNTDIDNDGNPTNISFNVDIDSLRQSVFDFRNFLD